MRLILSVLVCGLVTCGIAASAEAQATPAGAAVKVFKTPTCGCCQKWVDHLKAAGFTVTVEEMSTVDAVKDKSGVPPALRSCHTALVQGYVVEGHVPAETVRRLLKEKPKVLGIAVPGMPIGSPGMEQGDRKDPYDVMSFTKDGTTGVYQKH